MEPRLNTAPSASEVGGSRHRANSGKHQLLWNTRTTAGRRLDDGTKGPVARKQSPNLPLMPTTTPSTVKFS